MTTVRFKPRVELTFNTVIEVRARLYKALKNDKVTQLSFDLSEVTYCDSAGIALLIEARKLCKKNNKIIEIVGMSLEAQSLAEFCGVKNILAVEQSPVLVTS